MKLFIILSIICGVCYSQDNRIRVAIIDSGIALGELSNYLCKDGHKDFSGTTIVDDNTHGTLIADLISQYVNPSKVCFVIIKYFSSSAWAKHNTGQTMTESLWWAINQSVQYINVSSSGEDLIDTERQAIEAALVRHIRVVVSAGNNGTNLSKKCTSFPACYPIKNYNFFIVGALSNSGSRLPMSNYNGPVTNYENGLTLCTENIKSSEFRTCKTGTSMSTAIFTGKLIRKEVH